MNQDYKRKRKDCRMGRTEFLRLCKVYYMTRPEWSNIHPDFDYAYYQSCLFTYKFLKSFFINHKSFILMEKENPYKRTSTANLLAKLQSGKEEAAVAQLMAQTLDRRKKLPEDLHAFLTVPENGEDKKSKKDKKGAKAEKPTDKNEKKGKIEKPEPTATKELSKKELKAKKKADKAAKEKAEKEAKPLTKKEKKAAKKLAKKEAKAAKKDGKKKERKQKEALVDMETYDEFLKGDHVSFSANESQKKEFKTDTIEAIIVFVHIGESGQPYARIAGTYAAEGWKVCHKLTMITRAKKVKAKVRENLLAKFNAKSEKAAANKEKKEAAAKKKADALKAATDETAKDSKKKNKKDKKKKKK